jgi:hypothetical protein
MFAEVKIRSKLMILSDMRMCAHPTLGEAYDRLADRSLTAEYIVNGTHHDMDYVFL